MINHHLFLNSILNRTFKVDCFGDEFYVNFLEGDIYELNKHLNSTNIKYPLIWMLTGYKIMDSNTTNGLTRYKDVLLLLITKGDKEDRYLKRYGNTFDTILYPMYEKIKSVFKRNSVVMTSNDNQLEAFPLNDWNQKNQRLSIYGEKAKPQTVVTNDIWDAVSLQTDLEISQNCISSKFLIKKI